VYLNNGSGFSSTATNWAVPDNSPYQTYSPASSNMNAVTTMDMNGDAKPDLVYTSYSYTVFGSPGNYYWKVHLNNGSGFSSTAINWSIPDNSPYESYHSAFSNENAVSTMDMNGDSKPDLVYPSYNYTVFGSPGNYYWKVYLNTGSGFSSGSSAWTVPDLSPYETNRPAYSNANAVSTIDLNGDHKPDLVYPSYNYTVFGTPGNYYWKVYLNNGTGFSSASSAWTVPDLSPYEIYRPAFSNANAVSTMDINGDSKADLIYPSYSYTVFGSPGNYYWKVYLNNGSGFVSSVLNWSVPDNSPYETTRPAFSNKNAVSTIDMNGDSKADLIYPSYSYTIFGNPGNYYWKAFLNTAPSTGITNLEKQAGELIIYPNPTSGLITLNDIEGKTVFVYNALGILVQTELQTGGANYELDLSQQPKGIYFVRVGILTKKVIKE
jgi:hypothetical protein